MMARRFPIPLWVVLRIAERDKWTCHVDGLGYMPNDPWEIDHNIALSKGGTNHVSNLRLAHRSCNRDKASA